MPGRRERKKAATRQALADAALELFLARGYEDVTVAEIAEVADVSVTTLFNHFPGGKPALVFDQAQDRENALVAAIRDRDHGVGVVPALREHLRDALSISPSSDPEVRERMRRFRELILANRPLMEHSRAIWAAQESALTEAIVETGAEHEASAALAHLVIDGFLYAGRSDDPPTAFDRVMTLLAEGWENALPAG